MTVSTTSSTCQRSRIVTTGGENKFLLGAVQGLLEELLSLLGIRHGCKSNYRFDWQGHRRFYKGCAVERDVRGKLQLATFFISVGVVLTCLLVLLVRLPSKLLGLPNVLVWTPQKSVYLLNRVRLGHRVFLTFRIGLGHGIQLDGWVSVWCLFFDDRGFFLVFFVFLVFLVFLALRTILDSSLLLFLLLLLFFLGSSVFQG